MSFGSLASAIASFLDVSGCVARRKVKSCGTSSAWARSKSEAAPAIYSLPSWGAEGMAIDADATVMPPVPVMWHMIRVASPLSLMSVYEPITLLPSACVLYRRQRPDHRV